jgi:hypothetical protein
MKHTFLPYACLAASAGATLTERAAQLKYVTVNGANILPPKTMLEVAPLIKPAAIIQVNPLIRPNAKRQLVRFGPFILPPNVRAECVNPRSMTNVISDNDTTGSWT